MTPRVPPLIVATLLVLAPAAPAADFRLKLPLGLQEQAAYIPEDNPLTAEKIALGKPARFAEVDSKCAGSP